MTILFVIDQFEIGGIVSFLETLVSFFVQKGLKVVILGGKNSNKNFPFSKHFDFPKVEIYTYSIWKGKRWLEDFSRVTGSFFAFGKIVQKHKIDLIAFNHPGPAFGIFLHPQSKKIPKVFHFHGAWDIEERNAFVLPEHHQKSFFWRNWRLLKLKIRLSLYYLIEQFCLLKSNILVSLSQKSKELLLSHFKYLDRKEIAILPSGVNLEFFKPARNKTKLRKKLLLDGKAPLLFTLCRFDKKKGLENLLEAVMILKKKKLSFKLIVAAPVESGWFYNQAVFRLYEKLNLQTIVQFVHRLGKSEKLAFFQVADLFVLSSIGYEAYPYVVMEALACGLPVVATPVGGVPDMLGGLESELLIRSKNAVSLAEKIEWFLKITNQKREELSKKCLSFAEKNLDGRKRNQDIFALYQKMLKLKK